MIINERKKYINLRNESMNFKIFMTVLICHIFIISCVSIKVSTTKNESESEANPASKTLIRDCPDKKVVNRFPSSGSKKPNVYYIYNGQNISSNKVDEEWVNNHCQFEIKYID